MRKIIFIIIVLTTLINGCSSSKGEQFNDNEIKITLINIETKNEYKSYIIEVKNEGKVEVTNLNLFLYYPVITQNGSKMNPFKVEGNTEIGKPINLKTGDKVKYTVFAPVKEVFGDSILLDFNNPKIELKGFAKQGNSEIPFQMMRSYIN